MLNKSVKYLDMGHNRFTSSDHIIASKLGRLVQGHPNLLHVNFEQCQLVREELIYLIMCVRDSKNIQGFHLSGNKCSYYDRLLMRSLLPCKVRWPNPPNYTPKFEKIAGREKITLIMLNLCFMSTLPPNYMPEIGLSTVKTVEDVRDKIRTFEKRKQIERQIEANKDKEYKCTEVQYKELIEQRLDTVLQRKKKEALMAGGDDDDNSEDLRIQEVSASEIDTSISQLRGTPSPLSGKKGNFTSSAIGGNNNDFKRYYYDPDERIYDMFTMIDFYGRKKYCLEMGHPLTKEDDKWYRD